MAKKERLQNIDDPTLALLNINSGKAEEKSAVKAPAKKAPAKTPVKKEASAKAAEKDTSSVTVSEPVTVPELLKRPAKERLTKRFMVLLPESLYIRLFNASVESEKSLNKYILDVLKEHADSNGL